MRKVGPVDVGMLGALDQREPKANHFDIELQMRILVQVF